MAKRPTGDRWQSLDSEGGPAAPAPPKATPEEPTYIDREALGMAKLPRRKPEPRSDKVGLLSDEAKQAAAERTSKLVAASKSKVAFVAEKAVGTISKAVALASDNGPGVVAKLVAVGTSKRFVLTVLALGALAGAGSGSYYVYTHKNDPKPTPQATNEVTRSPAARVSPVPQKTAPALVAPAVEEALGPAPGPTYAEAKAVQAVAVEAIGTPPKRKPNGFPIMPELSQLTVVGKEVDLGKPQVGRGAPPASTEGAATAPAAKPAAVKKDYQDQEAELEDFFGDLNK